MPHAGSSPTQPGSSSAGRSLRIPGWNDGAPILVLTIVFLIANLLTASLSPTVWVDEVLYADPAIRLLERGTFSSSGWYAQSKEEFWAGNVPLHQILLYGWIRLFGVSPTSVRS